MFDPTVDQDKQIRRETGILAVIGIIAVLAFALMAFGCGGDPTAPTPVASASPAPVPTPDPARCEARYCEIFGDSIVFGIGPKQERELKLLVLDAFRTPIDNKCEFPRRITWSHDGSIEPTGSRSGSAFKYYAVTSGTANIYVEVGDRANCRFSVRIEE